MWRASEWAALCLAAAAAAAGPLCRAPGCEQDEYNKQRFTVEGFAITLQFENNKLTINCNEARVLDSPALPVYEPPIDALHVTFLSCPLPARSLAAVLSALNATLMFADTLGSLTLEKLPPLPKLAASHLTGLECLLNLKLSAKSTRPHSPELGFLEKMRSLRTLHVKSVHLAPKELDHPPSELRVLRLHEINWVRLPEALVTLPSLIELSLNDERITKILIPANLRTLSMKYTESSMNDVPTLEDLTLVKWRWQQPLAFANCSALRALTLLQPAAESLPPGWVERCPRLDKLIVKYAYKLSALPADLLKGATALEQLTFMQGALDALPAGLLAHAPNLRVLDLSLNLLHTLPSRAFEVPRALSELNLASNLLTGEALQALRALRSLTVLNLAHNSRIADICDENGDSPLLNQTKLTSLDLLNTGVTRICRDWRINLFLLETLNLMATKISSLTFSDTQFLRTNTSAKVYLQGAPVRSVVFTVDNYTAALKAPVGGGAVLYLNSTLDSCDCRMYWMRRALELKPPKLDVRGLYCRAGSALRATALEDMYCKAENACSAAGLPERCACWRQPRDGGGHVVRADCAWRNLTSVPTLRAQPATRYRLLLSGNNITRLRAVDLDPHLQELDLRKNFLEAVDEEAAHALEWHPHLLRLSLADNRLACDCRAAPLQRAMRSRFAADLRNLTCHNGTVLTALPTEHCASRTSPTAWLVAVLVVLAALVTAASAAAACVTSHDCRMLLRVLLHRWGMLRRSAEPDDARRFDAFVSFSHEDEEVVRALVARLEAGPTPYRLCLHYRDWVPGRWIPNLIRASVSQSRRTLALVSRHFLESEWACAEFREAYAHALRDVTPRLVVVLLEEPAALPLDSELRRYLKANTYVRWGDTWFWEKLALALPEPRPPLPPPLATVADKVPWPPPARVANVLSDSKRIISGPPSE